MKSKISVTIDEEMIKVIEDLCKDAKFRNRSHVVEYSLKKVIGERK